MSDGRVLAPFGRRTVPVIARERHGAYVLLRCDDPEGPRPHAGQFYMLSAASRWGGGEAERPFLPRAFSVLRAPVDTGTLEFMLEDVGPGTNRLCELEAGHQLQLLGPLGNGFRDPDNGRRALLVGGGVGIAPLAILQEQVESAGADSIARSAGADLAASPVVALLGFRDAHHAAGAGLLRAATVATDDGSVGHDGLVTELLIAELDRDVDAEVYACGPPPMLEAVRAICALRDVPAQLALESGMACGFGACFGCVVPTKSGYLRVCVDGPVFAASTLETVL
ncbi:MAG: dihydroorotate dehydrogenase electron transfer subunit [Solirubrobacteraceae bacterium]